MKITSLILISILATTLTACKNSDGSNVSTYSSCTITDSNALFAKDRAKDIRQCWGGVDIEEKNKALNWCGEKVNSYLGENYVMGHSVKYQVLSTNCQ